MKAHPTIRLVETYFIDENEIRSEVYFTGATPSPILLDNFSPDYRDEIVGIHKYSRLLSATELGIELSTTLNRVASWKGTGNLPTCTLAFEDLSLPETGLFVKFSPDSAKGKVGWHLYNKIYDEAVGVQERLRRGNIILTSLGNPFGDLSGHFVADEEFLEFVPMSNSRLLSDTGHGFGFGDTRAEKSVSLDFEAEELPLVIEGFQNLISKLEISGRLCLRMTHKLDSYSFWVQNFDHGAGHYKYHYEGVLRQSAASFFRGESSQAPTGFVPFGKFDLGPDIGYATLSFDFLKEGTYFYLSGDGDASLDGMTEFLNVTGLSEFVDELSLVSE